MYKFLPEILDEVCQRIRAAGTLIDYSYEGDYIYRLQSDNLSRILLPSHYIIIESGIFAGTHKIIAVDYENKTFDIKIIDGISGVISGNWFAKAPYFYFSNPHEYTGYITGNFKREKSEINNFPGIFLQTEFTEKNLTGDIYECSIYIAFIDYTNKAITTPQRHVNEIPYLFFLYENFLREFKKHENIKDTKFESHKKIYNADLKTNTTNNIIELFITINYLNKQIC